MLTAVIWLIFIYRDCTNKDFRAGAAFADIFNCLSLVNQISLTYNYEQKS